MQIDLLDLSKFLSDNNLGIYFVNEPLTKMPSQDCGALYQMNDVHIDTFLSRLTAYLENNETEPK